MEIIKKILINIKSGNDRTSFPETFKEELNYQCGRILSLASFFALGWFAYIPIDLQLHPDKPLIIAIRISFPVVGLIIFLLKFADSVRNHNLLMLTFFSAYLTISTAVLTAVTKGDPAYIGGYLFIITLLAVAPLQKTAAYSILAMSLTSFFVVGYFSGMKFNSYHSRYSLNDTIIVSLVVICFIYILNNSRYMGWYKSKQVEIGDDVLNIQKIYSESIKKIVIEKTQELESERNNLKLRNEIMENDLLMAKKIHAQLMPAEEPPDFIYSLYKPMDLIGGDFYDFIKFQDSEKFGVFVSDVSGHGLAAAFVTSMIKTILLQAGDKKQNPAELLMYMNDILYNQTGDNFITAFYGIYDKGTRKFVFSNAGHNQPFIITDGSACQLQGYKSIPLAIQRNSFLMELNKQYANSEVLLQPESKLLLYTDGFTECQPLGNTGLFFEESIMTETFVKNKHHPCRQFIENLYSILIDFRGKESFEDDVCLICLDVV